MTVPKLVDAFYERIWNAGDFEAVAEILSEDFLFRGSLGSLRSGRASFSDYVREVRGALSDYHCEIVECVSDEKRAFAKMRFSGKHTAEFRGFPPTGQPVYWLGAALFHFNDNIINELWVLGDLNGLDALLKSNQQEKLNRKQ
jgi:steroid delta-isomerase-like uncharacterized protein